ncbi:MAG: hypothetical protein HKN58_00135 [Xanthomonadales bacterium]|nr:hypothetical protein [Xanthomonadales bacterium]
MLGIDNMPGPVTGPATAEQGGIKGSFRGKRARDGGPGNLGGGGCLVFRATDAAPEACEADAQCAVSLEQPGLPGVSMAVYGYCISDTPGAQGQCWYKPFPDTQHCRKGVDIDGLGYELGPVDPFPLGKDLAMQWRVLTCQNLKPAGCINGAEGDGKRTRYGDKRTIRSAP